MKYFWMLREKNSKQLFSYVGFKPQQNMALKFHGQQIEHIYFHTPKQNLSPPVVLYLITAPYCSYFRDI